MAWFSALIAFLFLVLPAAASAEEVPIDIAVPAGCVLVRQEGGHWVCDYDMPGSIGARHRRIVISVQDIPQRPDALAYLGTLSQDEIGKALEEEIRGIDDRRAASHPEGDYERSDYRFLGKTARPAGLAACSRMMDTMTPAGSSETATRANLHCFTIDVKAGKAVQLLVSLLEFNDSTRAPSPTLDRDFDRIVESIRLNR